VKPTASSVRRSPIAEVLTISCTLIAVLFLAANPILGSASNPSDVAIAQRVTRIADPPKSGRLPQHVIDAAAYQQSLPRHPSGYETLLQTILKNRRDLAEGRITESQAQALGGTAITGVKSFPVFPVLFSNTQSDPYPSSYLQEQLFGTWPTGSLQDYYSEVSYNNFTVDGTVYDWFRLSHTDSFYEGSVNGLLVPGGDAHTGDLIWETLEHFDPEVDFSQYDNDGPDGIPNTTDDDGWVDFTMFVQPESCATCDPDGGNIWSHWCWLAAWISDFQTDDPSNSPESYHGYTSVVPYFICSAVECDGVTQAGIGTPAHEFGHALGIADLYDTQYSSAGLGEWCLMSGGNRNTPDSPAHMSAWVKERLGWLSYFNVTNNLESLCIPPVETHPVAVRLWNQGGASKEYFLVENRQKIGFDSELHAPGLVIYHVDEQVYEDRAPLNQVQVYETHKAIDVECADSYVAGHVGNADDLDARENWGDSGDVWCPLTQKEFTASTTPDTRAYSDDATVVGVRNIDSCTGGVHGDPGWICADYAVGAYLNPGLCIQDCEDDDCAEITDCGAWWASPDLWIDNDRDGHDDLPADGILNLLWFRVHSLSPEPLSGALMTLYYGDPAMGQLWPSTATALIDTVIVPLIGTGYYADTTGVAEFFYPDPPTYVDHYCIGAVVTHPGAPQNSEYAPNDNNVAQVNHQVLIERAGGGAQVAGGGGQFAGGGQGAGGGAEAAEGTEGSLLTCSGDFVKTSKIMLYDGYNPTGGMVTAQVVVGSDAYIPAHWTLSILPSAGPFYLWPGHPDSVRVRVMSSTATEGDSAHIPLTLVNIMTGVPMGGVVLDYKIDCTAPATPETTYAHWRYLPPDFQTGPTVEVSWRKVTRDVRDGLERVKKYLIYRSDDAGGTEQLVDEVAIDANPDKEGYQWYDWLPMDCDVTYAYRIRAVDGADYIGDYSDPIVLSCATSGVTEGVGGEGGQGGEGAGWETAGGASASGPNPFGSQTVVSYAIASPGRVTLRIYDIAGRPVRTLVDGWRKSNYYEVEWNGRDAEGEAVSPGVYFYRIEGPGLLETRKLVRVK
jgi:M6 family metalloprotease-like protein